VTRTSLAGKVELHRGQSYKSALLDEPGPYLLGLGTIARNGGFSGGSLRTYGGESPERILLRPGDLYLSLKDVTHKAELLGAVARVPEHIELGRLTQDTVRLQITSDQVHADYLYWLLQTPDYRAYCRLRGTGTTNLDLSRADFLGYEFRLPSVGEQQAIAEVLGALDDKIAANTTLAATARELGVAMLRIDGPTTALGDVVAHHKQQINPLTMDATIVEHYSLPAFDSGSGPEIVDPGSIKSSKFSVHGPAVLVSKLNPQTPRVWPVLPDGSAPRLASTEFLVLEPRVTSPWVMWALLSQPNYARSLQAMVAGTSGSHQRVRPDDVLAAPILDPRAIPQQLLADVGEVLAPIDVLSQENRTLAATRDALLPQLMSGKLRVRDAERIAEDAGA